MQMIYTIPGFTPKLDENDGIYNIYLYNRLVLKPLEKQLISLPIRLFNPTRKYINLDIDKGLALNGLQIIWHNLNDLSAWNAIELLIYNQNMDYDVLYKTHNPLYSITGSSNKLDLKSETLLGKVFFT